MKTQKPLVKLDEINPEPVEIIAASILEIAQAMKALNSTRLKRSVIVTLIHDRSKIGKRDIELVLNNLASLEEDYLKIKIGERP